MTTVNSQQTDYISPAQTMTPAERQWQQLWQDIEEAGGRYQYIQQQMLQHGFMVERKPIDNMSPKERERYKKSLKKKPLKKKISKNRHGKPTKRSTSSIWDAISIGQMIPASTNGMLKTPAIDSLKTNCHSSANTPNWQQLSI